MRRQIQRQAGRAVQRHFDPATPYDPTVPSLYGNSSTSCCQPLFNNQCLDGSLGLFFAGGESSLAMQWFGFRRATARRTEVAFLQYIGGVKQAVGATNMPGVPSNICAPGETTSFGEPCTITQDCFGLLKLCSDPMIDGGNQLPYCERYPTFSVDGMQIDNDEMWHEAVLTEAWMATLSYNLLWGVKDATTNKMGHYGLWSLLGGYGDARDYVYQCPEMKPHILDWAGNPVCAPTAQTGITLDGQALGAEFTLNLYSTIRDYFRGMMRRLARTRGIASGNFNYGDWAILGPAEVFDCLIECATCFTECSGNMAWMDSERAAAKLQELRGAGEGYGALDIDGYMIPLIPYDPIIVDQIGAAAPTFQGSLKNADGTYNIMLLYRGSGSQRVLQPEYNPLDDSKLYDTRDNGMVQLILISDDVCTKECFRHEWRWGLNRASFLNLLIKNVQCTTLISDQLLTTLTEAPATVCP